MRKLLLLTGLLAFGVFLVTRYAPAPAPPPESDSSVWSPPQAYPDVLQQYHADIRTADGADRPAYPPHYKSAAWQQAKALRKTAADPLPWIERGPGNVGGRTRGLIIDAADPSNNTWIAGSVGGGIWKTTNAGGNWTNLTPDLPNLSTGTLAQAPSNAAIIYAGTGEGFGNIDGISGDGIWKSTDGGQSWTQLASTAGNADYVTVNRIVVDPANADILLAGTSTGIFKSTNGGQSFNMVYEYTGPISIFRQGRVQHIVADPDNFNTLYAGVNSVGVVRSTNAGDTWTQVLDSRLVGGRLELAIAPSNTDWIYAAIEGGTGSVLYLSDNGGASWVEVADTGSNPDWLGGQGWYDNTIMVHPFDETVVFVGGIQLWRIQVEAGSSTRRTVTGLVANGTESFLGFQPFTGNFLPGLGLGPDEDAIGITEADFVSVEIRFGPGVGQKAHRFTVPEGATSGVSPTNYSYQEYVDVPFEVWDVTNDRQIMASFRDQTTDGTWNLPNNDPGDNSLNREYLFINAIPYNGDTPNPSIAQNGGQVNKLIYFLWPTKVEGSTFDPNTLPASNYRINYGDLVVRNRSTASISGAANIHVDHHNLIAYDIDEAAQTFKVLNASDGGVAVSNDGGGVWRQTINGFNVTQFYGADKKPGEDVYLGGTQDNGTWRSRLGTDAATDWFFQIGGDGFDVIWHAEDPNKLMGGNQFNGNGLGLSRSMDGGDTWVAAVNGLVDTGQGAGPFITKLAKSKLDPDLVFAIGTQGVWRSADFGDTWTLSPIPSNQWNMGSTGEVEVSKANPQIVWAGVRVSTSGTPGRLHLSNDAGFTFNSVDVLDNRLGTISGLTTHPLDDGTAYVLFSAANRGKILRTTDFGQNWEDLTGFSGGNGSTNGFPDVAVYDLLVMPHNTDEIWAGTEIGLFISTDGGGSWAYADNGLPAVSIWDMKIVDDEVVVATHGRGVWSVSIPEILNAPQPNVLLAPRLNNVEFLLTGGLNLDLELRSSYDSTQVLVDGTVIASEPASEPGTTTIQVPFRSSDAGDVAVSVAAFSGDRMVNSGAETVEVFPIPAAQVSYENTFEGFSANRDFTGDALSLFRLAGNLQSPHTYGNDQNRTFTLKIPIVVSPVVSTVRYADVALFEPGLDGFTWDQPGFRDYAIFEGTSDGVNWIPLLDGYDARFDPAWRTLFPSGNAPDPTLVREHEVDLLDFFEAGERVFLRFRYFSDNLSDGWGWLIEDLEVQPGAPVDTEDDTPGLPEVFALNQNYPNPFNPVTTIAFTVPEVSDVSVRIYDLNGREVAVLANDTYPAGTHQVQWHAGAHASGVYFYRMTAGEYAQTRKLTLLK